MNKEFVKWLEQQEYACYFNTLMAVERPKWIIFQIQQWSDLRWTWNRILEIR